MMSKLTGCYHKLEDLLPNDLTYDPFKENQVLAALRRAYSIPMEKRTAIVENLTERVMDRDIYDYTGRMLNAVLTHKKR